MTIVLLNAQSRNCPQISISIGAVFRPLFSKQCLAHRFITGQSEELMSEECSALGGGGPSPQESGTT